MAYLYRAEIFKSSTGLGGWTQAQIDQNNSDRSNFETNFKSTAVKISIVFLGATTFITELSYANFKAKIVSPIAWTDVKYIENNTSYSLNIISDNPL